ncbi:MAG: 50S ribosomal protein L18a [Candidatus Heimdallarchaeota archaeon]|nr:50S ribosomal protein L18a [Candidatus Heimdallarchaeota archaeon]
MVKVYRVTGELRKTQKKMKIPLMMEVRAHKVEDVLEKVFSEIGSRHRVKREDILIPKDGGIVEITPEEARSPIFQQMDESSFVITQD